ncbi:MAG: nucleoside recognition domain-containing protein [Myxococcota bacterium]
MNVVFYALVLVSVLAAGWNRVPERRSDVRDGAVSLMTPVGLDASLATPVNVTVGGVTWHARVAAVEGKALRIRTGAPDGAAVVTFPETQTVALVSKAAFDGVKGGVDLVIGLVGAMTFFLGLMKVLEAAGGLDALARLIRPVMVKLFPDVPSDHPAMGAMIMNIAANVLGLGNAATPFGVKAMQELEKLNKHPGVATDAMVLFLAINTSGVAVLPTGVIAMRAALKSTDPAAIFLPTLAASALNTVVAVLAAKALSRLFRAPSPPERHAAPIPLLSLVPLVLIVGAFGALVAAAFLLGDRVTAWIVPMLIAGMLTAGVVRGVRVYEVFIDGAKDGFSSAIRIIPFVVAILAAVGMFSASGAMELLLRGVAPVAALVGMPAEALPLALVRPLSGSGAFALTGELTRTYGPDSFVGHVVGTMQGTTETTFYVLAVYFGAVGINKTRHAVPTGIISDLSGVIAAVWAVRLLLG